MKQCRLTYRLVHLFHGIHTTAADMEWKPKIGSYDTLWCVPIIKEWLHCQYGEKKNARELASFKSSGLSSQRIELDRFSRRLSCNPSPALIIFSGFSPLNRFGGESYLVMSRRFDPTMKSQPSIKSKTFYHTTTPYLQIIKVSKHNCYTSGLKFVFLLDWEHVKLLFPMLVSLGGTPTWRLHAGLCNLSKISRQIFEDRENMQT